MSPTNPVIKSLAVIISMLIIGTLTLAATEHTAGGDLGYTTDSPVPCDENSFWRPA